MHVFCKRDRDGWEATGKQLARASHPLRKSIMATSQQKTAGVVTAPIHHLSACGAWERRANEPSEVSQIEFVSKAFLCTGKKKKKTFGVVLSRETKRHRNSVICKRKTRIMAKNGGRRLEGNE